MKARTLKTTIDIDTHNQIVKLQRAKARRLAMNDVFWRVVIFGTIGLLVAVWIADQ